MEKASDMRDGGLTRGRLVGQRASLPGMVHQKHRLAPPGPPLHACRLLPLSPPCSSIVIMNEDRLLMILS